MMRVAAFIELSKSSAGALHHSREEVSSRHLVVHALPLKVVLDVSVDSGSRSYQQLFM